MPAFVVSLSVTGRACLVIGGDAEALRRAQRLRKCGAEVTVVWPEVSDALAEWMRREGVRWEARAPVEGDLTARPFVAVSTPRDEALSRWLFELAAREGVLLCCVDQLPFANYAHVATADAGTVTLGLSSGGTAPGLVARLRDAIASGLGGDFEDFTRHLADLRARTRPDARRAVLDAALDGLRVKLDVTLPEGWRRG
jgi:siroheme synthase-like protein